MKNFLFYALFLSFAVYSFIDASAHPEYVFGLLIFTAPGGVGTPFSFNMTYLPEFLQWNDGANPLTSLRIETQQDGVIHDLNAAGIAAVNGYLKVGALPANTNELVIADGQLDNKNVTISGVTSAAGAVPFFVASDNKGIVPLKTSNANVLPLQPTTFTKFTALFLPFLVTATDRVEITYSDGHVQNWDAVELALQSTSYQEVPGIIVNNIAANIAKATVTSVLGGNAIVLSVNI